MSGTSIHPLHSLGASCGDVSIRFCSGPLIEQAGIAASQPLHRGGWSPFSSGWSLLTPQQRRRHIVEYLTVLNGRPPSPDSWWLPLAVVRSGEVVGMVSAQASMFGLCGTAVTGTWLVGAAQGAGIGTQARRLLLELLFGPLGVARAVSVIRADNAVSIAVTEKLGFTRYASQMDTFGGQQCLSHSYRLDASRWMADERRPHPEFTGLSGVRALFGSDAVDRYLGLSGLESSTCCLSLSSS